MHQVPRESFSHALGARFKHCLRVTLHLAALSFSLSALARTALHYTISIVAAACIADAPH